MRLARERPGTSKVAGPIHVVAGARLGVSVGAVAFLLLLPSCAEGPGAVASSARTPLLGPESFPCRPETGDLGYTRYGVGAMRRGGWEREELEPDHIVVDGKAVNLHGTERVSAGETIEMEMDEDYFAPSVVKGAPGATVTFELVNDGTRPHNFNVPGQDIDLKCGVRSRDEVTVTFPRSGVLLFSCTYTASSGMRGALVVGRR